MSVQVGDTIRVIEPQGSRVNRGDVMKVLCVDSFGAVYLFKDGEGSSCGCIKNHKWAVRSYEVIKSKSDTMNLKEKFLLAFKSEPQKSFRQKGITNGDDMLTEDGQEVFINWLLQKNADEFKKEVVDSIEKDEK